MVAERPIHLRQNGLGSGSGLSIPRGEDRCTRLQAHVPIFSRLTTMLPQSLEDCA
jgi:hypothetical protein